MNNINKYPQSCGKGTISHYSGKGITSLYCYIIIISDSYKIGISLFQLCGCIDVFPAINIFWRTISNKIVVNSLKFVCIV